MGAVLQGLKLHTTFFRAVTTVYVFFFATTFLCFAVVAYLVEWALDSTFADSSSSTVSLLSGGAPFHKVRS